MTTPGPATLPEDIARVIRDAFEGQPCTEVESLSGGRSGAATFSVAVAGTRYIARRSKRGSEPQIHCLQVASERRVAPRVVHADVGSGVAIMEHIDGPPVRLNGAHPEQITAVARTLRQLHDGPAFAQAVDLKGLISSMDGAVRAAGTSGLSPALVQTLNETILLTARFAGAAPCHNDLHPGNILQRDGRIYFVDWDTAANNDPFFDVAEIGVFGCPSPIDRAHLLHEYLGHAPNLAESARAVVARVGALGFYSAAFAIVSAHTGSFNPSAEPLPMDELLQTFGTTAAPPAVVAASLFAEMQREHATASYERAKRQLD